MSTGGGGRPSHPRSSFYGGRHGRRRVLSREELLLAEINDSGALFGHKDDFIPVSNDIFTHSPNEILFGKTRRPKKSRSPESW